MKIFISSDIEGTNGICAWDETQKGAEPYSPFANRMTAEVNAVCEGINKASEDAEIYVKDAHDSGRNLIHDMLPQNVVLNRSWGSSPYSMMFGIDKSFDATIFTGYHNAADTDTNPLAHTMSSADISYITINGIIASEFLINYYSSLYNGVPVVMVAGDKGLCDFIKTIDENIYTVATSVGIASSVTSPHPLVTQKLLAEQAKLAIENRNKMKIELPKHFETKVRYTTHKQALRHSYYPGAVQESAHIVKFSCDNYFDFLTFLMFR